MLSLIAAKRISAPCLLRIHLVWLVLFQRDTTRVVGRQQTSIILVMCNPVYCSTRTAFTQQERHAVPYSSQTIHVPRHHSLAPKHAVPRKNLQTQMITHSPVSSIWSESKRHWRRNCWFFFDSHSVRSPYRNVKAMCMQEVYWSLAFCGE